MNRASLKKDFRFEPPERPVFSRNYGFPPLREGKSFESHSCTRQNAYGFTILEVLVATTVGVILGLMLVLMLGNVSKIWVSSNAKMSSLHGGRAIVDFMSRDLRSLQPPKPATRVTASAFFSEIGNFQLDPKPYCYLQFLLDAGHQSGGLNPYLPQGLTIVPNSSNFFGQMTGEPTVNGDSWIVGYYLAQDSAGRRRLYRTLVSPTAGDNTYKLFEHADGIQAGNPIANSWIYDANLFKEWDADKGYGSAPIADDVAAFWVEALDGAGNAIPWLAGKAPSSAPLKFDSAAHFYMPRGTRAMELKNDGKPTFAYLNDDAATWDSNQQRTLSAHELPAALRITIVTTSDFYLKRGKTLPDPPALTDPASLQNSGAAENMEKAAEYQLELYKAGQPQAAIFSAVVELPVKIGP